MIHLGEGIILIGVLAMIFPFGKTIALTGLILIGLGCAPIYPSIIHSTPAHFGADKSQSIIGVQMAFCLYWNLSDASIFWHYCKIHRYYTLSDLSGSLFMHHVLYV